MYLQITSRCNMKCAHCGMSCTSKGQDMSIETFRNAIDQFGTDCLTIGGGEPTIHPLFWQILMESIAASESVWMATNGKVKEIALALANLAKKGVLGVDLSQDEYHEPIDGEVIQAFTKNNANWISVQEHNDSRGIRDTSSQLIKAGRCKEGLDDCICPDIFVKPNGEVKGCGCKNAPVFGNVNTEVTIPDNWNHGECYKKQSNP